MWLMKTLYEKKVVKFGGSSLASAEQFVKSANIIKAESVRRFVVPSAPGKRFDGATEMLRDMDEFRKDPTMLFDYHVPPLDAVIGISKPPIPMPGRQHRQHLYWHV